MPPYSHANIHPYRISDTSVNGVVATSNPSKVGPGVRFPLDATVAHRQLQFQ